MASTTAQQLIYGQFVTAQTTNMRTVKLGGSGRQGNGPIALSLTWGVPTAARSLTIPDPGGDDTFTMNAATQTLTNKTFSAPVFTGQLSLASGTVGAPSLTFTGNLDTGLYRIGANNIGVAANGAKVLDIGTTGLGVTGAVNATGSSATELTVAKAGTDYVFQVDTSVTSAVTGIAIQSQASGNAAVLQVISTAATEGLQIKMKGTGKTLLVADGSGGGNVILRSLGTIVSDGALTVTAGGATITAGNLGVGAAVDASRGINLRPNALTGVGQIGIIVNPTASSASTSSLDGVYIQLETTAASYTITSAYGVQIRNHSKGAGSSITNAYGMYVLGQTSGGTNNYGVYIEAPSGAATNNIGLYNAGTTTLVGATTLNGATTRAVDGIQIGAASSNNLLDDASNGASAVALFIGNTQITAVSDVRIKANIRPSTVNATDLILRTPVVDHTWNHPADSAPVNKNSRGPWVGIIAQDLIKTMPWLVNAEDRDCPICLAGQECAAHPTPWNVDFDMGFPTLVKAIQELEGRIRELEAAAK